MSNLTPEQLAKKRAYNEANKEYQNAKVTQINLWRLSEKQLLTAVQLDRLEKVTAIVDRWIKEGKIKPRARKSAQKQTVEERRKYQRDWYQQKKKIEDKEFLDEYKKHYEE